MRLTAPLAWAGDTAMRRVAVVLVTVAATLPKRTMAPFWKLLPTMVTTVPPVGGPEVGETLVTVGGVTV